MEWIAVEGTRSYWQWISVDNSRNTSHREEISKEVLVAHNDSAGWIFWMGIHDLDHLGYPMTESRSFLLALRQGLVQNPPAYSSEATIRPGRWWPETSPCHKINCFWVITVDSKTSSPEGLWAETTIAFDQPIISAVFSGDARCLRCLSCLRCLRCLLPSPSQVFH